MGLWHFYRTCWRAPVTEVSCVSRIPLWIQGSHAYCPLWENQISWAWGASPVSQPTACSGIVLSSSNLPAETGSRNWHKKIPRLWLLLLLWVINTFASEPGVSHLLPDSIRPWQANLFTYKDGKHLHFFKVLDDEKITVTQRGWCWPRGPLFHILYKWTDLRQVRSLLRP